MGRTKVAVVLFTLGMCAVAFVCAATESSAAGTHRTWARHFALAPPVFEPAATSVGSDGSVYMCGVHVASPPPDYDGFVIKYRRNGARWIRTYRHDPVTPTIDIFRDVGADKYGNVYVCGITGSAPASTDVLLVKYSPGGTVRWRLAYDHASLGRADAAVAMVVTPGGTVYLAGTTAGIPFATGGWLVLKVSPGGVVRWSQIYRGPAGDDEAASIARDSRGNVLVSGTSRSSAGHYDCVTLAFDRRTGDRVWPSEARFARPGEESGPIVVANPRGGCYVALRSDLNKGAGDDVVLLKYAASGKRHWARRYDGPDHRAEAVRDMAVDTAGNAYIAGCCERATGPPNSGLAIRYTRGGKRVWTKLYRDLKAGREAEFFAVALDSSRRPYFGGVVGAAASDALLRAYTPAGRLRWRDEYDGALKGQEGYYGVVAWRTSAVYGCGGSVVSVTPPDVRGLVVRYRP